MPYIKDDRRLRKNETFPLADNAGELNYLITVLLIRYIVDRDLSYQVINDVIGALEGAKAEFYRRVAVPYESKKIAENGDVYPAWMV